MSDIEKIPFDASPQMWLAHDTLGAWADAGIHYVQILSMEGDGAWVRLLEVETAKGWKVYVPRERIFALWMKDEAWPDE